MYVFPWQVKDFGHYPKNNGVCHKETYLLWSTSAVNPVKEIVDKRTSQNIRILINVQ